MRIEFIKAYDSNVWETEVIDVPDEITAPDGMYGDGPKPISSDDPHWDAAIIAWCHDHLATQAQYRNVVYWGIYNSDPEADEEEEDRFKVVWSSEHAAGELPGSWATYQEAVDAGENWKNEMVAADDDPAAANNDYSFEVIDHE